MSNDNPTITVFVTFYKGIVNSACASGDHEKINQLEAGFLRKHGYESPEDYNDNRGMYATYEYEIIDAEMI
jgi:hypothetical protein